jgi:PTH1 family peptidyl-tRNA hydrolase
MKIMGLQDIKLIIGLGNPGKEYEKTYHNVGFLFVDYLKTDSKLQMHPNLRILKSETYMNESGKFVAKTLKKTGARPRELMIIHDDSDIEIGKYKISFGRGSAGHNGVESIIKSLGTKNFWRLRMGVRPPKSKLKAERFVLKKISKNDLEILKKTFKEVVEKV